jgi:hypothetical protein
MAIGAGLASIKAFGMLARGVIGNSSPEPFAIQAFATLVFGDDPALLKEPAILTFLFGSGAVLGVFWARVVRRWSSGDFS